MNSIGKILGPFSITLLFVAIVFNTFIAYDMYRMTRQYDQNQWGANITLFILSSGIGFIVMSLW